MFYPYICNYSTTDTFKNVFKEKFTRYSFETFLINLFILCSLGLETSLFDNTDPHWDWDRHTVINTFCDEDAATNWEGILDDADAEYVNDLFSYAQGNLIKLHLFISTPFATEFERYTETPRINFVANIGGKLLIMNMIVLQGSLFDNKYFRSNGTLHGFQFCEFCRNSLLPRTIFTFSFSEQK